MHLDVHHLRDFYYRTRLGRAAQKALRDALLARWGAARGLSVAGYGFAVPLLRPFLPQAARVIGVMPAPQGVMHWPADGPNHSVLVDESRWALPNDSIDRLVMLHGLETSDRPMALLDEAHRVLAPQGRAVFLLPSRSGLWARRDATPFGFGRPWSRGQIERLLVETGFTPTGHAAALFFPPLSHPFWLRAAGGMERMGRRYAPERIGGVLLVEAIRSDAAPRQRGTPVTARRPLAVLDGVPQGHAQPAWRDWRREGPDAPGDHRAVPFMSLAASGLVESMSVESHGRVTGEMLTNRGIAVGGGGVAESGIAGGRLNAAMPQ